MIAFVLNLICGTAIRKYLSIGLIVAVALAIGMLQIRSCQHLQAENRELRAAIKILEQDRKLQQQNEDHKSEIDNFTTPDEFNAEFDRLHRKSRGN